EAVTQRLPIWDRLAPEDPVPPNTLSAPLLDIARHCLRSDPKRRWTIGDIASRLNPAAAAPPPRQPIERAHMSARSRYLIPAALVLLLIVAAVAGLKVFNSETKARPEPTATTETTPPEPGQVENITAPENDQPTSNEKKNLDRVPDAPAPVQPKQPASVPVTGASGEDVIHRVIPDAPQGALDTIRGTVRVSIRVSVTPAGEVSEVTIDSPGPSKYFAKLAQQAAQQWKFAPGIATDWILRFEFSATGVKAFSAQAAP
ncbi:MAG TPA: TonB family protein, partial [Candidatus Acidoferrales bacterium]|nr:TonB family protein [Candidatus Acidoferrales bacterium]